MKQMRKMLCVVIVLLTVMLFTIPVTPTSASQNLVAVKKSNGSNLTYRNSSEVVYRLSEFNYPTNQLRAAWVSHFAGDVSAYSNESQYKSMMNGVLDNMEKMGMNAIVYHVRTHNNAMYKSELNPVSRWFANVNFDEFDPIEWLIEECHSRGIEFHAWLNPYRVSTSGGNISNSSGSLPAVNPANKEENLIRVGNNVILDPGIPEVREFIVDTCLELAENYDIDAIHFDDYFYISGADDTATRNKYNTEGLSLGDFRRKQVDLFIEDLSKNIREYNAKNNKCIQIGISPSNVYRNGGYVEKPTYDANGNLTAPLYSNSGGFAHYDNYLYSDTLNWINHEWIDYIMPQCYHALENTAAPFADIVKWWSWAVRYKKVNLYAGIGIYMAIDNSGAWGPHADEVELQLLVAGQYAEYKGTCFYKYASMLNTSTEIIKNGVDVISNDFWKKRVPGAINQYYAPLVDAIDPISVTYNNGVISWTPVENTRGYIVYQVPKGQLLDKNNINHLLEYTQSTSISIQDVTAYDYYVSSVNLANEASNGVLVNVNINAEQVIGLINSLPTNITFEHKNQVLSVKTIYDKLSETEKEKVTNYNVLVNALNKLATYDGLESKLDEYINSLDTHIFTDRPLTSPSNITLKYKNDSDQSKYDFVTGVKHKNYLATTLIPLIATIEIDGATLSKEFNVNIGYVATNQTGLFYRNDPSAMGTDDEGSYNEDDSKFIGWSGHTFVIESNVLFIAKNSYVEITDPNEIKQCTWTSVAGVYVNKTSQTITMKMGDAFEKNSSLQDGYIIISGGKVSETSSGWDLEKTMTLKPNDAVIIVRYLDGLISGSPFVPVTNVEIGATAYIDTPKELTPEEEASSMISAIDRINLPVSLEQEAYINNLKKSYDSLSEEVKQLVTNKDVLLSAVSSLETLKAELELYKKDAISKFEQAIDLTKYSSSNQTVIKGIIATLKTNVNNATTKTLVDQAVSAQTTELAKVKTLEQEKIATLIDEINKISTPITLTQEAKLKELKATYDSLSDVAKAQVTNYQTLKDALDAIAVLNGEKELNDTKAEYINKIDELIATYEVSNKLREELVKKGDNFKVQINNAKTVGDVKYIFSNVKPTIDAYFDNLSKAKQEAKDLILSYIEELEYSNLEIKEINKLKEDLFKEIDEMVEITLIKECPNSFATTVENYHNTLTIAKEEAIATLVSLKQTWYSNAQNEYIQDLINVAIPLINNAGTTQSVEALESEYTEKVNTYINEITNKINETHGLLDSKVVEYEAIKSLITETKRKVYEAKTVEAIEQLVNEFNLRYQTLYNEFQNQSKEPAKSRCNNSTNVVITFVSILSVFVIAIAIKKHAIR